VLSDLIENTDFQTATAGDGIRKRQVVFGGTTRVGFSQLEFNLEESFREKGISSEIRDDLLSRNPTGKRFILARYQPSNPNILLRDLSQIDQDLGFSTQFPKARGFVESSLPGYSRDGSTAVVLFSFGQTPHGAIGHYLLSKKYGHWEIDDRLLGYFD